MKTICVISHGFAGSKQEVEFLYDYLTQNGIECACITLKGHGETRRDLARSYYMDWITQARQDVQKIIKGYDRVVFVGFSMGGLIGANLCSDLPIDRMVFVNTPIFYWNLHIIRKNLHSDLKNRRCEHLRRYYGSITIPLRALVQFTKLLRHARENAFSSVCCDCLILQGKNDDTVQQRSARYIHDAVQSGRKEIRYYEKGVHQIFECEEKESVSRDILEFICADC